MDVATTEITGRRGATLVEELFLEAYWVPREIKDTDVGVDFYVEVATHGQGTGRHIAAQVKTGPSFFGSPSGNGWWFPFGDKYRQYWLNHDLPVIIVLVDLESRTAYWQAVTADTVRSTGEGWKIEVPREQVLGDGSLAALSALVDEPRPRGDRALTSFYDDLGMLPREAVGPLARLHAGVPGPDLKARRPVERLAATLAQMRDTPDAACELLLDRTPRWLSGHTNKSTVWKGPDQGEVWLAVGGYANEHTLPDRAAEACRRAVDAGAAPGDRWRAIAGLFEMVSDPQRARTSLEAVRESDEGRVLAAVGLAVLDHAGRPGPVPVPAELSPQTAAGWEGNATARLFLGEQARRRQDLDEALEHYQAALDLCPGSATAQVHVAQVLLERLNTHASASRDADVRRAVRLAEEARADRRRWAGPSEVAAEVLLRARILLPDVDAALAVALPEPDGEATEREAVAPHLAALAARIAYRDGRIELGDTLTERSTTTSPVHGPELAALRVTATGAPVEEQVPVWQEALRAATTDELRFVAVQQLTDLGQWPVAELEELRAAGTVREDVYAVMAAKAHRRGDSAGAARFLRPYLRSSVHAVLCLADITEADGNPEQAAAILQEGAARLSDPHLELAALDVLRRANDHQAARAQALRLLTRPSTPHQIRLRLLRDLIRQANTEADWSGAAEHALSGLDEIARAHPDAGPAALAGVEPLTDDFVWCRIGALYNLRLWDEAWKVCERYQVAPAQRMEALIWIPLTARQPWTPRGANAMLDLCDRFADDGLVVARALNAVDLALAVAHDPDSARFGSPWAPHPSPDELNELRSRAAGATADFQERHPEDSPRTVTGNPGPAALRAILSGQADLNETHEEICQAVRDGDAALGLIASTIQRPYMLSLVQRGAGLIPACSTDPTVTASERDAAAAALDGPVVVDPSALYVASLLPGRWDSLFAQFSAVAMPQVCMDDLLLTQHAVQRLQASSFTAGLSSDGTAVQVTVLTDDARNHLSALMSALLKAARTTTLKTVTTLSAAQGALAGAPPAAGTVDGLDSDLDGAWAAPLELAITTSLPLWSDDLYLREAARSVGVPAFGTRALTHVLTAEQRTPDTRNADDALWLAGYVVDLPHDQAPLLAQAEADKWLPAAVATALTRPAAWHPPAAVETWATIANQVVTHAPQQLASWLYLASLGAAVASDPATLVAQLLAIAVIEAGPGSAPSLAEASAGAAQARNLPAYLWREAVTRELEAATAAGHLPGLPAEFVADLIGRLVQGP
ncbi:DUF4365 domain-containing protein [Kitasatospora sp. NPDC048722]|uniref:DUF4365 domain-containing protein n=1 Tax=Kitasatospora sp. NPDC048722 TaxID=3155639 RepID=UPI0033C0A16B